MRKQTEELYPSQDHCSWWCGDLTQLIWPQIPCSFSSHHATFPSKDLLALGINAPKMNWSKWLRTVPVSSFFMCRAFLTQKILNSNLRKTHTMEVTFIQKGHFDIFLLSLADAFKIEIKIFRIQRVSQESVSWGGTGGIGLHQGFLTATSVLDSSLLWRLPYAL